MLCLHGCNISCPSTSTLKLSQNLRLLIGPRRRKVEELSFFSSFLFKGFNVEGKKGILQPFSKTLGSSRGSPVKALRLRTSRPRSWSPHRCTRKARTGCGSGSTSFINRNKGSWNIYNSSLFVFLFTSNFRNPANAPKSETHSADVECFSVLLKSKYLQAEYVLISVLLSQLEPISHALNDTRHKRYPKNISDLLIQELTVRRPELSWFNTERPSCSVSMCQC